VTRRQIEGVTRLEHLLPIAAAVLQPPLEDVAPMRAGALVVGKALQQRGLVDVPSEHDEVHRVAGDIVGLLDDQTVVSTARRALPRNLRHLLPLSR